VAYVVIIAVERDDAMIPLFYILVVAGADTGAHVSRPINSRAVVLSRAARHRDKKKPSKKKNDGELHDIDKGVLHDEQRKCRDWL
jgi:hypothetical protein